MNKEIICWYCEKSNFVRSDFFGDMNCEYCGVMLTVYNPAEFKPPELDESEEDMGQLAELAKKQSKYLILEINESEVAIYKDFRIIPSQYDPDKETVQYCLSIDGVDKFWTNGSNYIMKAFDEIPKGSKVKITRLPFEDKAGNVVEGKSSYKVEKA